MSESLLSNARIVTRDAVIEGSLCIRNGKIHGLDTSTFHASTPENLDGDYLLPGLVELHTDNLEKHMHPRPGVLWPSGLSAMLTHDAQLIGSGITTVLDAISCGELMPGSMRNALFASAISAVTEGRRQGVLRAEHFLHLRCEISDAKLMELFLPAVDDEAVRLVSVMDHTPGQRQFTNLDKFREYYQDRAKWTSDADFNASLPQFLEEQKNLHEPRKKDVMAVCRERGLPVASHDDTLVEHVDEAKADGVNISEFPTTLAAARRAREHGLATVLGAPNVVRGKSHSGNVSASELAAEGLLSALSSDYVPASLMHAAFMLYDQGLLSLPEAIATVSATPASLVGLDDRGKIEEGLRADLTRVRLVDGVPVVRAVWSGGKRIQ